MVAANWALGPELMAAKIIGPISWRGKMKRLHLPFVYLLGATVNRLARMDMPVPSVVVSSPIGLPEMERIHLAIEVGEITQQLLDRFPDMTYCRRAGEEVIAWVAQVRQVGGVAGPAVQQLIHDARRFETLLLEELSQQAVFHVTKTALLNNAENELPDSSRIKFRGQVIDEIQQAAKCLAFDIPTAAGFHILRALELVMEDYYYAVCKPSKKKPLTTWGAYVKALKTEQLKTGGKKAAKVIVILEDIGLSDRNLIMHPKRVLDLDEGLALFKECESLMITMSRDLPVDEQQKWRIEAARRLGAG